MAKTTGSPRLLAFLAFFLFLSGPYFPPGGLETCAVTQEMADILLCRGLRDDVAPSM